MSMNRAAMSRRGEQNELVALLRRQGIESVLISSEQDLDVLTSEPTPDLALVETSYLTAVEIRRCLQACVEAEVPSIALAPRSRVSRLDPTLPMTDFITSPPDPDELVIRAQLALDGAGQDGADSHIIKARDLRIDTSSYEVTLRGERIGLRFKEYELLKLLAENPGRVFSRDALLNQIWGYEYFGGTRTVDVHIRRLRSKIEDSEYNFIETVWNVGYRFNKAR